LFCFDGTGLWTQVIMLAKQVLYHLNHTSSPTSSLEMKFSPWEKSHTLLCNTGPLCTLSILSCTILKSIFKVQNLITIIFIASTSTS
jgi:hypothetical protein